MPALELPEKGMHGLGMKRLEEIPRVLGGWLGLPVHPEPRF